VLPPGVDGDNGGEPLGEQVAAQPGQTTAARLAARVQVAVEHGVELPARLCGQALPARVRIAEQVVAVVVDLANLLEPERRVAARCRTGSGGLGEPDGPVGHSRRYRHVPHHRGEVARHRGQRVPAGRSSGQRGDRRGGGPTTHRRGDGRGLAHGGRGRDRTRPDPWHGVDADGRQPECQDREQDRGGVPPSRAPRPAPEHLGAGGGHRGAFRSLQASGSGRRTEGPAASWGGASRPGAVLRVALGYRMRARLALEVQRGPPSRSTRTSTGRSRRARRYQGRGSQV
jgi:hypothetical protein